MSWCRFADSSTAWDVSCWFWPVPSRHNLCLLWVLLFVCVLFLLDCVERASSWVTSSIVCPHPVVSLDNGNYSFVLLIFTSYECSGMDRLLWEENKSQLACLVTIICIYKKCGVYHASALMCFGECTCWWYWRWMSLTVPLLGLGSDSAKSARKVAL